MSRVLPKSEQQRILKSTTAVSLDTVTLDAIRDVSKAMIQAYLVLLFDALGLEQPIIQPKAA
jgi:hypothetical protein